MATMIALLRGVNVGANILRMERLREFCAEIGMQNVRTYVQSGNIVFEAEGGVTKWVIAIERRLRGETRLPVSVVVRMPNDLERTLTGNPFLKEKGVDESRLHVTMLASNPTKTALKALAALSVPGARNFGRDRFIQIGRDIYLHCPDGYGRTKLNNTFFEKILSVRATTRNWNTLKNLAAMAAQ
jgi:uncharacterized protein (DUF1697 family)